MQQISTFPKIRNFTIDNRLRSIYMLSSPVRTPEAVFVLLEYTRSVSWPDVVRGD